MSRSSPTVTNPANRFFEWSGGDGTLSYYDKEAKEKVNVPLPFEFLVLDELATLTGWSDEAQSNWHSNEVRSIAKEQLVARTWDGGLSETGYYKEMTVARSKGAKYAKSIYIAYLTENGHVLGNLKLSGTGLTAWIEFSKGKHVQQGKCILTGSVEGKKGRVTFQQPVFEYVHSDSDEDEIAIALDKELQIYLNQYLAAKTEDAAWPSDFVEDDVVDDAPSGDDLNQTLNENVEKVWGKDSIPNNRA